MHLRSEERRRIGWRHCAQQHRGAMRPGWLPLFAVGSAPAAHLPDGNAVCSSRLSPPGNRCSSAVAWAQGGRPLYRKATVAAVREAFDRATATWREAEPVTLAPAHRRRRLHNCEVDACWPT